jgi:cation diffusion facilitator family transporter
MPETTDGRPQDVTPVLTEPGAVTTRQVVTVSLSVDILDVITNFVVAMITGSAVVFAEMAQGLADACGSAFLLIGDVRSRRPPDAKYPLGYGREVFFWALLSALSMLVIGAGLSLWRGLSQLGRPDPLEHPYLALGVVVLSIVTNGYAVSRSVKRLRAVDPSLREAYGKTGQPLVKTALLQDALGTTSSIIGFVSICSYMLFGAVLIDAVGAIALAVFMTVTSGLLVSQARGFIAGRSVPAAVRATLLAAIRALPEVTAVNRLQAVYVGSEAIRVHVDLDFADGLTTNDIERSVDRVQDALRAAVPGVSSISVDLNSPRPGR